MSGSLLFASRTMRAILDGMRTLLDRLGRRGDAGPIPTPPSRRSRPRAGGSPVFLVRLSYRSRQRRRRDPRHSPALRREITEILLTADRSPHLRDAARE